MLTISLRPCILGEKYGGKKQKNSSSKTLKVELQFIELDANELNALHGSPDAFNFWYREEYDKTLEKLVPVPRWEGMYKTHELAERMELAHVVLWVEGRRTIVSRANLSGMKLMYTRGGMTYLDITVEGEPVLDKSFGELISRLGTRIEIEIAVVSKKDQQQLALNSFGNGEDTRFRPPVGGIGGDSDHPEAH